MNKFVLSLKNILYYPLLEKLDSYCLTKYHIIKNVYFF